MNGLRHGKGTSANQPPARVLAVDDMATNRGVIKAVLRAPEFEVVEAASGDQALSVLSARSMDAVLLDVMMPGMNGIEVCRRIRCELGLDLLPVIMVTSLGDPTDVVSGMEAGATDYLARPFHGGELQARVRAAVDHKRLTDRLDEAESVLFALARVVEAKDATTGNHCDRLRHYGRVFGKALDLGFEDMEALRRGAILHDIGKVAVPEKVLLKPGPLSEEEWLIIKQHPVIGAQLCKPLKTMQRTVEIVRHHHEKWNGSGYPAGLAGTEIPVLARVFQILDVYDALSSDRPYKAAFSSDEVLRILREETERGFWDPELMSVFLDLLRNHPESLSPSTDEAAGKDAQIFRDIAGTGINEWERG